MANKRLLEGSEFKGHRDVVIQDIQFKSDNVKFQIERYFVPSLNGVIEGKLPAGFDDGQYGPGIRTFCRMLYYQGRVTQNKIAKILSGMAVMISEAELSRMINDIPEVLLTDREEARQTGVSKAGYLQADHTGAKIPGQSGHTLVLCNEYFTDFTTGESKSRLSFIQALWGENSSLYRMNRTALAYLKGKISKKHLKNLGKAQSDDFYTQEEFDAKMLHWKTIKALPESSKKEVVTACAIAGYRGADSGLVLKSPILISDDASNFNNIFRSHGGCWVHEARHYELIHIFCDYHQKILDTFLDKLWKLYRRIQAYQRVPNDIEKMLITKEFDSIFTTKTDFNRLNEILPLTVKRKKKLLLALDYPHIPLHNNISETDLRERVIKRKISYGNRSWQGVKAWDTYMSLMHTCRKLGVSFWSYLQDRAYRKFEIPTFRKLIQAI